MHLDKSVSSTYTFFFNKKLGFLGSRPRFWPKTKKLAKKLEASNLKSCFWGNTYHNFLLRLFVKEPPTMNKTLTNKSKLAVLVAKYISFVKKYEISSIFDTFSCKSSKFELRNFWPILKKLDAWNWQFDKKLEAWPPKWGFL